MIIIINNIISANIIIVTVVIFGHAFAGAFVDMALFIPCVLKDRSCTTKANLFPA